MYRFGLFFLFCFSIKQTKLQWVLLLQAIRRYSPSSETGEEVQEKAALEPGNLGDLQTEQSVKCDFALFRMIIKFLLANKTIWH